jgi:hypothetical protein
MAKHTPLFANERTAAQLFDMTLTEFLALVEQGCLPKPRDIGGIKRWDVNELTRIAKGEAINGGTMEW